MRKLNLQDLWLIAIGLNLGALISYFTEPPNDPLISAAALIACCAMVAFYREKAPRP